MNHPSPETSLRHSAVTCQECLPKNIRTEQRLLVLCGLGGRSPKYFFFFLQNLFIIFLIFHTDKTTGTYGRVREGQVQSILLKHNLGQSQINPNTNTGDKIPLNPPLSLKHTIPSTQTNNTHAQRGKGEEGKIK